jgi:hypothetical protein
VTRAPKPKKELTRFAAWRARMSDRMARSSRVFLLGLVLACGIEVLVDWNQTLMEINVQRSSVRQKGESYVGILSHASGRELAVKNVPALDRLSHGIFDDDDAIYVRFTDASGAVVWDQLKSDFAEAFKQRGASDAFAEHYARPMQRDTNGILKDPEGFKARLAASRYKDFAQSWTDATAKVIALVVPPKPQASKHGLIIYQDRLRDENHQKDDKVSYAIGTILDEDGKDIGTILVAFDMLRTNETVRFKYVKFAGLVVFFVALILVQNTVSRRNKLRLLDLETRYSAAKKALRDAMPAKDVRCGALLASGHVEQAKGPVDGMLWSAADEGDSLLAVVIDPDGDGIDAAAVGLHVGRAFLARRNEASKPTLDDEMRALGEAAASIPLTRPIGLLLVRVDARTGVYHVLAASFAQVRILGGATPETVALEPSDVEASEGVIGPLLRASGTLEAGRSIVGICSSTAQKDAKAFADGVAKYLARTHEPNKDVPVEDAAIWARGRNAALAENDIALLSVTRESKD